MKRLSFSRLTVKFIGGLASISTGHLLFTSMKMKNNIVDLLELIKIKQQITILKDLNDNFRSIIFISLGINIIVIIVSIVAYLIMDKENIKNKLI